MATKLSLSPSLPDTGGIFTEAGSRHQRAGSDVANASELPRFFSAAGKILLRAELRHRERDRAEAKRFSVFNFFETDEKLLSDIIAELLSPNGKHGQGDSFLRLMLGQLDVPVSDGNRASITVHREAPTHGISRYRRRMDLLVEGDFLLAIENKFGATEQPDQVKDYLNHLAHVTRSSGKNYALLYLTPNGDWPESLTVARRQAARDAGILHCWSYQSGLRRWLELCRQACAAAKVRHFLDDFINFVGATVNSGAARDRQDDNHEP